MLTDILVKLSMNNYKRLKIVLVSFFLLTSLYSHTGIFIANRSQPYTKGSIVFYRRAGTGNSYFTHMKKFAGTWHSFMFLTKENQAHVDKIISRKIFEINF